MPFLWRRNRSGYKFANRHKRIEVQGKRPLAALLRNGKFSTQNEAITQLQTAALFQKRGCSPQSGGNAASHT
eukprot:1158460-Pelagomonas_calceolata.AAC.8